MADARLHRHKNLAGAWVTGKADGLHTHPAYLLEAQLAANGMSLTALKAAVSGGGSTGGTPGPITPPPPPPPPTEVVARPTSLSAFLTDLYGPYDAVEYPGGNLTWQNGVWGGAGLLDRTSRPLIVRPIVGGDTKFIGPASSTGSIFQIGSGSSGIVKKITWQGVDKNGGGSTFIRDFLLAQSGAIEPVSFDDVEFNYLTFANLGRDAVYNPTPGAHRSWCYYISGRGGGYNGAIRIGYNTFKAPQVSRDISCIQYASSGSGAAITVDHVLEMTNYHYGYFQERTGTIAADTWAMTNTGRSSTPASIRLHDDFSTSAAATISGHFNGIIATGSDPYLDEHTGGGTVTLSGNSGI